MSAESPLPNVSNSTAARGPTVLRAVVWEFWRSSRWTLVLMALILAGGAAFGGIASWIEMDDRPSGERWDNLSIGVSMASMLVLIYAFFFAVVWPFTSAGIEQGRSHDRLFRLPLATWKLALAYMLPGLLFAVCVSLPVGYLLQILPTTMEAGWTATATCLGLLAVTALGQAWALIFGTYHRRSGFVVLCVVVLLFIQLLAIGLENNRSVNSFPFGALIVALVIVCYALGLLGLIINRRGGLTPYTHEIIERLAKAELSTARAHRFATPQEAQRWYEWRRLGWLLPGTQVAILFFYLAFIPGLIWSINVMEDTFGEFYRTWALEGSSVWTCLFMLLIVSPAAVGIAALSFDMQDHFLRVRGGSFYLTRPVSHHLLASARFAAATKNAAYGLIPVFAVFAFYFSHPSLRTYLIETAQVSPGFGGPVLTPVFLLGAIAVMWASVFVVNWGAALAAGIVSFGPAIGFLIVAGDRRSAAVEWRLETMFAISALVYAAFVIACFGIVILRALRQHAIGPRQLVAVAAIWTLGLSAVLTFVTSTGLIERARWGEPFVPVVAAMAIVGCFLPAAPLVTTPYMIHANRHRA